MNFLAGSDGIKKNTKIVTNCNRRKYSKKSRKISPKGSQEIKKMSQIQKDILGMKNKISALEMARRDVDHSKINVKC